MLPGLAYESWLTMTTLEHLDEIGTRHDVPRFGPSVEVKTYSCLIILMLYVYSVAGDVDGGYGSYSDYRGYAG
jgi:hypothetical protein